MVFGQQGNGPIGHLLLLGHVSNLGRQTGGLSPCSSIVGIRALKSIEKSSNMLTLVVEITKRVFISTRMLNFFSPQHIEKLLLFDTERQTNAPSPTNEPPLLPAAKLCQNRVHPKMDFLENK